MGPRKAHLPRVDRVFAREYPRRDNERGQNA
jgi:hypothetical protein